jgi:hypothetical protein
MDGVQQENFQEDHQHKDGQRVHAHPYQRPAAL